MRVEAKPVEHARVTAREDLAAAERAAVGADGEPPDVARAVLDVAHAGVGDVEQALVRRERQSVGPDEVGGDGRARAARGVEAVHVGGVELRRRRVAFVVGVDAVGRIGEPDRAVGLDDHVVRRVEALAADAVDQDGARAVVLGAGHAAGLMLARHQAALAVDGVTVGVVAGLAEHRHRAVGLIPAHHPIVRDVGPHEVATRGEVGRAFAPAAAGPQPVELGVEQRQPPEAIIEHGVQGHQLTTFAPRP
ncbi:MAG TPA: hypothetical protein VGD80_03735 [Kofleriaceae bacterium]